MPRYYRVITTVDESTGRNTAFGVSDITDDEYEIEKKLAKKREGHERYKYQYNEEIRPRVATFQVTGLYGADEQKELAHALCAFMNKYAEARDHALKQNSLVDVLTSNAAEYRTKEDDKDVV
jgi:hypothetical protein